MTESPVPDTQDAIGRASFALRLLIAAAAGFALYFGMLAGVMKAGGHSGTALLGMVAIGLVVSAVYFVLVARYLWLPRLRDIGLRDAPLWVALFLCLLPATAGFALLALAGAAQRPRARPDLTGLSAR